MVYFDLSNRFTSVPWNIVLFVKKTRMLFTRRPVNYSITWDLVGHEIKRWLTRQQEGTALDELLLQSSHYAFACLALVEHRESILFHPLNLFARGTSSCWPNERARISRIRGTLPETICNYDKRMIESNATEISVTFNSPRVSIELVSLNCALSSQPRRFLQQPRSLRCVSSLRINAPSIFDNSGHSGLRAFYRKSCLASVITSIGTRRLVLLSKHFKSRGLLEVTVRGRLPGRCQCLWTGYPRCSRGSSGSSFSVFHAESGPRTWNTYRPLRVGILWPHLLCPVCSRSPGSEFIVPQVHSERRRPANCSLQTWGQLWIGLRKGHRLSFLRRDSSAIFFSCFLSRSNRASSPLSRTVRTV